MKAALLLSLLVVSVHAAPADQRDQGSAAAASMRSACPVMSYAQIIQHYGNQLLAHVGPFSLGVLGGAGIAGLETEIVNPIVSYVLKGYSDSLVVATEVGILGVAGYMAYKNQDSDTIEEVTQPTTLIGLLAGCVAWYHFHG